MRFLAASVIVIGIASLGRSAGLPTASEQVIVKSLQDTSVEVRTAAALALAAMPDEKAVKPLESMLIASADPAEQDAAAQALIALADKNTAKRLSESLSNPQFTWGTGAKAKAVEVVGKIWEKKAVKWLTDLLNSEQEPAVKVAALKALILIGAPPKKEGK
jgi:HEAT repeat protein